MERKTFAARSNKDVFRHSLLSAADATWKNFHLVRHSMALWVCLSDRNCRMASSRAMPTIVMELHNSTLYITLALTVWRATLPFPTFIIFHLRFSCFSWFVSCLQVSASRSGFDFARLSRRLCGYFRRIRQALDWEMNETCRTGCEKKNWKWRKHFSARLSPAFQHGNNEAHADCRDSDAFFFSVARQSFFCEMKLHRLTCRRGQKKRQMQSSRHKTSLIPVSREIFAIFFFFHFQTGNWASSGANELRKIKFPLAFIPDSLYCNVFCSFASCQWQSPS